VPAAPSYEVRNYRPEDLGFLRDMSYEAAFWRPDIHRPPRDEALSDPAIARYLEGWGRPGDAAVVAVERVSGTRMGAAWYRIMPEDAPGYGFISPGVPEVSIGVVAGFRGHGVGGALLDVLLERARVEGFDTLSLSVERDNPAVRLYERHGFGKLFQVENAWTMKVDLTKRLT
jgi:ribosomal protein S18 acetylase RimI-like enzyme